MIKEIKPMITVLMILYLICHQIPVAKSNKAPGYRQLLVKPVPDSSNFKSVIQGKQVSLFILKNKNNASAAITNYGGRLVSMMMPDRNGVLTDVVLGYDSIAAYQKPNDPFFGALIGRFGNRITKGKFNLDGVTYHADINNGANSLHSGVNGFHTRVFKAKQLNKTQLELTYLSADGEGGYPGNLSVIVNYTLTNNNELKIEYTATTDKPTVINLTNHTYFNLNGAGTQTMTDNFLKINADNFLPVDATLIPTGELKAVEGTPFDFRNLKLIGNDIDQPDAQLKISNGYDHNFVLNKHTLKQPVATVKSPATGIVMDIYTDQPGLQFYSGNGLNARRKVGKNGAAYGFRSAICLETQHFPDSPNQPSFPSTLLKPAEKYHTITIYKFSKE